MKLSDLLDLDLLEELIEDGYITERRHPEHPLFILNYTDKTTYDRYWNDITRRCRGLIYNAVTMEVVARPFEKFFNHNEPGAPSIPPDCRPSVVTDKLDGSLGILYQAPDFSWAVATRGSFESEQAKHATEVYNSRYAAKFPPVRGWSYLFEVVFPENRIVCDYGSLDDLIHLGGIQNDTGLRVYDPRWPGPTAQEFHFDTYQDVLDAPYRPGKEGYVVETPFGTVKVKQPDYVALHKIVFGLNARAVWEVLSNDQDIVSFVRNLPEEFRPWAESCAMELRLQHSRWMLEKAYDPLNAIEEKFGRKYNRKEFAEEALKYDTPGPIFLALDGKGDQVREAAWKAVYPSHRWAPRAVSEDET